MGTGREILRGPFDLAQGMAQNDRKAEVSGLKFAVVLIMQIITTALPRIIGGTSDV